MTHASLLILMLAAAQTSDPFRDVVRPTDPLSPAEQQTRFHLPPGFQIQLFAAEPEIQKPMNMAFDAAGRLWMTGSVEYPYAAEQGEGQDAIRVLADTDGDGRADRVDTFADGLNIPMGLYPYQQGVVAYSIPNIWYFADTDADGRCDTRVVLYGPLGEPRDTHGMQNGFRRGFDGWLHINHGFSNESTIAGSDGSRITLQSGNTYRVRLDGSRVEQFTWGQVNPFGSSFLPDGDLVNADCHSKPLSLLLRGGYYPSFGKPDDGLGFVQPVMDHTHGSTAIAGVAVCTTPTWPEEFRGDLFVGNVMTCRVHRDSLEYRGSTMQAVEQPDFLTCDDPWFRPVDLQFGPDGALYIADFYNRIIGHYEVPLDHPQRDRTRGRIWRVHYVGEAEVDKPSRVIDLAAAPLDTLVGMLDDPELGVRMRATDGIVDRFGENAVSPLEAALPTSKNSSAVHMLWALHRLGALSESTVRRFAVSDDALVRIHAMRILAETPEWTEGIRADVITALDDADCRVRRAAADAIGLHPDPALVQPLLAALHVAPAEDAHLRQTIRIALRNQFRATGVLNSVATEVSDSQRDDIADVLLAVPTEESAEFLIGYLTQRGLRGPKAASFLSHAARHVPSAQVETLIELARDRGETDLAVQLQLLDSVKQAIARRGLTPPTSLSEWAEEIVRGLLAACEPSTSDWNEIMVNNKWGLERRNCADGQKGVSFLSSLPGGEQQTGTLRSRSFTLPASFQFYLCGHRGFPGQPASDANYVQIRLAESGEVIAREFPPRNDVARLVQWDLTSWLGKEAVFEVVDGMNLDAYAWLAVARFEPPVLKVPQVGPAEVVERHLAAASLVGAFRLESESGAMRQWVLSPNVDWKVRQAAAEALLSISPATPALAATIPLIGDANLSAPIRDTICRYVGEPSELSDEEIVRDAMRVLTTAGQASFADRLAGTAIGGELLLRAIELGHASARLLETAALKQKLTATKVPDAESRIGKLLAKLPPQDESIAKLIEQRVAGFDSSNTSAARGQLLFAKNCAACHQVRGTGAVIGPQLDGIGNRGLSRLVEDVLDPNRNVDAAFHTVVLVMTDGRVISGLPRREEGQLLILANAEGKEVAIQLDDIEERRMSPLSLMPSGFATSLPESDFGDLMAYLSSLRQ